MKSSRASMVMVAIAGLLSTAWGPGGTGENGLDPKVHHDNALTITGLMQSHLPPSDAKSAPAKVAALVNGTDMDRKLLQDTIGCALPVPLLLGGKYSYTYGTHEFHGESLMRLTTDWTTTSIPLSSQEVVDIHTCLLARLNAFDAVVRIFLYGPDVYRRADPAPYLYAEAVWLATLGAGGVIKMDAWPLDDLTKACGADLTKVEAVIKLRVCGKPGAGGGLSTCGVQVHKDDFKSSCVPISTPATAPAEAGWTCSPAAGVPKIPAVATRLGPCGMKKLYVASGCNKFQVPLSCGPNDL